jgi:phosphoribosylaminoimidazole-succinocarboxamide synthase
MPALFHSDVPGIACRRGKVRDVYDLGDRLVLVATDRISAFDHVLPTPIPDKGRVLTALTLFWLDHLGVPNHLIGTRLADMGPAFEARAEELEGRTCLVKKAHVAPIECVVRGYLVGSAWKDYTATGLVCGVPLPAGLRLAEKLQEPIFTPATKEESGHDQNISFREMAKRIDPALAEELRERSLGLYRRASAYAEGRGLLLADTKFEWGTLPGGEVVLVDEVLTPDSARFWEKATYAPGGNPLSFDKQFVRDWLGTTGWDKHGPPPELPAEVVGQTREKYLEALGRLTGRGLA